MTSCAFCGRENDAESRFCIDCGKPINPSAARVGPAYVPNPSGGQPQPVSAAVAASAPPASYSSGVPPTRVSDSAAACPRCGKPVNANLPFCAHCGTKIGARAEPGTCAQCGAAFTKGVDLFCARCGSRVGQRVSIELSASGLGTQVLGAGRLAAGPKLALLGETGEVLQSYTLDRGEAVIGRGDADIRFEDDHFMSPLHARLELRDGQLCLRDLGSRNGSWVFIDQPTRLTDGDLLLIGSQALRFRRLGYPGPHPPEADSTRRMGSQVPTVDIAVLEQLRADGSVRDVFHLSPGRSVTLGRESGDWIFPYDATMSGRHAEIRSEDSEFFVHDANSRNGVAMAVRGERGLKRGQRLLIGDQILRVESV
ncbi:MAG TPA: FHA domain-containing protein [Gemmatimonadaceae bacterium]|nr:FHA domain-containing protein [Gemmatimonadaceae bacterium]